MLKRHWFWLALAIVFLFLTALIHASRLFLQPTAFAFLPPSFLTSLMFISLINAYLLIPKQVAVNS